MNYLEQKIEFDKIRNIVSVRCLSDLGKSMVDEIVFENVIETIKLKLDLTAEFVQIIQNEAFPLEFLSDLRQSLKNINVEGTYISAEEAMNLWRSLTTLHKIINFFKTEINSTNFPTWASLARQTKFFTILFDFFKRILSSDGQIKDNASKDLSRIREEISQKERQLSSVVKNALSWAQQENIVDEDTSITVRNGRMLIPIDAGKKNKIPGVVQDYSSTGKTIYIEPLKSVELNNQLVSLFFEEKQEIVKILTELTNQIRPYIDDLLENFNFLALIDFTRAKAQFAIDISAQKPQLSENSELTLNFAYHPLLFLINKKSGKKTIPLDIKIDETQRIILISGPNAGGKSVAVKTVGLLQYMLQCGFLIPAKENSVCGIFDELFIDIGDQQSTENDLSTYSSHLLNLKNILQKANKNSLVMLDEFGAGTDPSMGGAIAEAILSKMLTEGIKAVVNTHYSNLKHFASQNDGISNAAMLFDYQNLRPMYILEVGHPGSSFAFEIAQKIGLPQNIIEDAKRRAGKSVVNFDKVISEIDTEKRALQKEKQILSKTKIELSEKVILYREERQKILEQRKQIIKQTQQMTNDLFAGANKLIENTIRKIKENNAEREFVKKTRIDFEKHKNEITKILKTEIHKIESEENTSKKEKKPKKQPSNIIKQGDLVKVKDTDLTGTIINVKDQKALIIAGNIRTFVDLNKLEKVGTEKQSNNTVKINIHTSSEASFDIDVRGYKMNEALEKVAKFIDTAIIADTKHLSILHGTGDGILRNAIRQYLKTLKEVELFADADIRFGGQGITLVNLK